MCLGSPRVHGESTPPSSTQVGCGILGGRRKKIEAARKTPERQKLKADLPGWPQNVASTSQAWIPQTSVFPHKPKLPKTKPWGEFTQSKENVPGVCRSGCNQTAAPSHAVPSELAAQSSRGDFCPMVQGIPLPSSPRTDTFLLSPIDPKWRTCCSSKNNIWSKGLRVPQIRPLFCNSF